MAHKCLSVVVLGCICFHDIGGVRETCEKLENCSNTTREEDGSFYVQGSGNWQYYLEVINGSVHSYSPCDESRGCGCLAPVISDDLRVWYEREEIRWEDFRLARDGKRGVHYQILNHTLLRQSHCLFPSRCKGVEHFLLALLPGLPDMEIIINVMDYPLASRHFQPLPIFSFSKTASYYDIMYPAWSFWAGGPVISTEPRGLGRWDLKRQSLSNSAETWPWRNKKDIGFFRGSRTSSERDPLILFSREKPLLVDAQYTKNQAWRSEKDSLGYPPVSEVPLEEHCQYKYLFNFRGVAASFRLKHLFLCGSLVLHVGEEWLEFFYPSLRPWVHYVPLPLDLSNLREVLEFLQAHDELAKEIADRGFDHIWKQLDMDHIMCYWRKLLRDYAELCRWTVHEEDTFLQIS